jgi:hypothetical protein
VGFTGQTALFKHCDEGGAAVERDLPVIKKQRLIQERFTDYSDYID